MIVVSITNPKDLPGEKMFHLIGVLVKDDAEAMGKFSEAGLPDDTVIYKMNGDYFAPTERTAI